MVLYPTYLSRFSLVAKPLHVFQHNVTWKGLGMRLPRTTLWGSRFPTHCTPNYNKAVSSLTWPCSLPTELPSSTTLPFRAAPSWCSVWSVSRTVPPRCLSRRHSRCLRRPCWDMRKMWSYWRPSLFVSHDWSHSLTRFVRWVRVCASASTTFSTTGVYV